MPIGVVVIQSLSVAHDTLDNKKEKMFNEMEEYLSILKI